VVLTAKEKKRKLRAVQTAREIVAGGRSAPERGHGDWPGFAFGAAQEQLALAERGRLAVEQRQRDEAAAATAAEEQRAAQAARRLVLEAELEALKQAEMAAATTGAGSGRPALPRPVLAALNPGPVLPAAGGGRFELRPVPQRTDLLPRLLPGVKVQGTPKVLLEQVPLLLKKEGTPFLSTADALETVARLQGYQSAFDAHQVPPVRGGGGGRGAREKRINP